MSNPDVQPGERLHMITSNGIFDLTDLHPDQLALALQGAILPSDHRFSRLHRRRTAITDHDRQIMYQRCGPARAIVEDPATYTWMRGFTSPDERVAKALAPIQRVLIPAIQTADIWNRFYGMGFAVLGFNDGGGLSTPLSADRKATAITWAHGFSRRHIRKIIYDKDPSSPTFGHPRLYRIISGRPGVEGEGTIEVEVHADRILPLRERAHIDPINGGSALDPAWNDLDDIAGIGWANGESYASNASPKLVIKTPRPLTPEQEKKTDAQLAEMQSNLRHVLKTLTQIDVQTLTKGSEIARPLEHLIVALSLLTISSGVPFSWFFRQHITSGEGMDWAMREWYEFVSARQQRFGISVVRDLLDRLIKAGILTEEQRDAEIEWHPPRVATREDLGKTMRNEATALATAGKTGYIPRELLPRIVKVPPDFIVNPKAEEKVQAEEGTPTPARNNPR